MKTPISYYGGKQAIIHHILPLIPAHEIYTECFFGGGTVFFAKEPVKNETINDRLDIVINFYAVLKSRFKPLKKMIDASLVSRTMHRTALMMCKKELPADPVSLAWAFWYCSNFSFICKIGAGIKYANEQDTVITTSLLNKKSSFTDHLASRIEKTQIECSDALLVLKSRNVAGAFHYLDTPYVDTDQGHYRGYTARDLEKLLQWCATECKGKFLLSNYNSELLSQYTEANQWHRMEITHRLKAPRKSRTEKKEVLIWNYTLPKPRDLFNQHH